MNSGNLLNNLLGITSANPGVTKSTAAKARAESTEKFHQALEHVRPEIAARKPAARKETPVAESTNTARPTPKPLARQDAQEKVERSAAQPKTLKDDQRVAAKDEAVSHSVEDKRANEPAEVKPTEEQSTDRQDHALEVGELSAGGQGLVEFEDSEIALEDSEIALEDLVPVTPTHTEEVVTALESSVSVLNPAPIQPLVMEESANEDKIELPPTPENVLVVAPNLMVADRPSQSIMTETDLAAGSEESLPFNISSPSSQLVASGVAVGAAVAVQSPTVLVATGILSAQATNPDVEVSEAEADLLAATDAEISINTDTGENPDFLLLNSKAALNKLAESAIAAATLDKAAPAVDVKPAAISAAVEVMTRLTEAQSPAARAFVVQTGVPVPVGSPQWSQAVGDKVLWFAAQNVSAAEIRLDPPELGPMQVKVSVNQDQASVTFSSPHPAVRDALDQQLNRLREMFAEQGLNLVNVDVSDKSFTKREQEEAAKQHRSGGEEDEELTPVAVSQAMSMRLVDHYA